MKEELLLTIIIPVYNTSTRLLIDCFDSINKINNSFEVIIVDDGSEKECALFLDNYLKKAPNYVIVHKNNSGVSDSRNVGIEMARGKYIAFVDSDDVVNPQWYTDAIKIALKNDYDMVCGKVHMCNRGDLPIFRTYEYEEKIFENEKMWEMQKLLLYDETFFLNNIEYLDHGQCGKIIKKELISDVRFIPELTISEDQVFINILVNRARKCLINNEYAYFYLFNQNSTTHNHITNSIDIESQSMSIIKDFLINEKVIDFYYYRVVKDLKLVIDNELFSKQISIQQYIKKMESVYENTCYREALKNFRFTLEKNIFDKIKFFLIKKRLVYTYFILKKMSKIKLFKCN